jgi:hypothetical protein
MISNIVDYKLDICINEIKENITVGSSKKQLKDITLKTIDIEKYFINHNNMQVGRPRLYPEMEANFNSNN